MLGAAAKTQGDAPLLPWVTGMFLRLNGSEQLSGWTLWWGRGCHCLSVSPCREEISIPCLPGRVWALRQGLLEGRSAPESALGKSRVELLAVSGSFAHVQAPLPAVLASDCPK